MSVRFAFLGALALSLLAGGVAQAKSWTVTLGARATASPPYEGADHDIIRGTPTFSIRPAETPYRFTPPDGGTTFALLDTAHFSLGPIVRFRYKRKSEGDLRGLREIKWAAEPGGFVDIWPTRWLRGRAELRHGVGGHHGFVGDVGADLVYTGRTSKWDASFGPRIGWGDTSYINQYFGVTPAEAIRSPLVNRPYSPDGGRRYTGLELAGAYHLSSQWIIKADVGYRRLADEPANSPIVQVGGGQSMYSGSIGVSYSFGLRL